MGLMESPMDRTQLVVTPHPVTLEGQTHVACELRPGESLYTFLDRTIDLSRDQWTVAIGGVPVPVEQWARIRPKDGQVIEVRGVVNRQVLMVVAMIALTYFTMGAGAGWIAGAFGVAAGGTAASLIGAGLFMAGSTLINKVIGPKPPGVASQDSNSVYSLSGSRNQLRQYEPLPLLFGSVRVTPDIASMPYTWYEGDDQYLAMVLTPGINVDRFEPLYNGETLLSAYEGVTVWTAGFGGMPEQAIPLYSNADTIPGAELNKNGTWVERTTSPDTVNVQVNIEYLLTDVTSKGKPFYNTETVVVQYRPTGTATWLPLITRTFRNNKPDTKRVTLSSVVTRGQYDIRVRRLGQAFEQLNGRAQFQYTTLTSVQADDTDYAGIPRIALQMKATGQLNGAPDEIRAVAHASPMPIWTGSGWATATTRANGLSNPGAQLLHYARGITDQNGKVIAGIGLADDMIDIPALQAFMLHCTANGYTYDHCVKGVRSHDEMVNSLALAGFGQVTWAGGRLSVVWAADEQPLSGVVNMATIKKGQFQVDYTLANAADGIEYSYFDRDTWETKTLRVMAPGVTTMLNPASVQGEGITSEAHAAEMARYHLAQSLYQYKDISYSTDIEHLSYRRLSVLALQHDLTQWGYGGRVVAAAVNAGAVTLTLDEPVPAPTAGNAYIGLRIPGEKVYRVFTVVPFAGESDTIALAGAWPADAPLPGDQADNPAHDTIWIYDFKQTPGYRVRVVGIEPESDLKGASVAVVPEPPEFWVYVKTGQYIPPSNQSLLQTRPIASNLQISETQVVQGDTVFTELTATFDITGPVGHVVVFSSQPGLERVEVAQTSTRTATWRIPEAGTYTITVRPFSPSGEVGIGVSAVYTTGAADAPPPPFDTFNVEELPGGMRKYSWGYAPTTVQAANFAGAEIRYVAGNSPAPVWETMAPLGEDGFFTAAVEMVIPQSGEWTFAARARNTSGALAPPILLTKTLVANLGQVIGGIDDQMEVLLQADLGAAQALAAETLARINADLAEAEAREEGDNELAAEITTLNGQLAGKASVGAVQGLTTRMTDAEGAIVANSSAITAVSAAVGGGITNNRIINPSGNVDTFGWGASGGTLTRANGGRIGAHFVLSAGNGDRSAFTDILNISAGDNYTFACSFTSSGSSVIIRLDIEWLNSSNSIISRISSNDFSNTNGSFIRRSVTGIAPAGTTFARVLIVFFNNSTDCRFTRAKFELGTIASAFTDDVTTLNNANAVTTLDARVTSVEGVNTSQATAITTLNSSLAGKAEASAVTALATRVTDAENSGNTNHVVNSTLNSGIGQITSFVSGSPAFSAAVLNGVAGANWYPPNINVVGGAATGVPNSGSYVNVEFKPRIPVSVNERWLGSAFVAIHRCSAQAIIAWCNADGTVLSFTDGTIFNIGGGSTPNGGRATLNAWTRVHVVGSAPASAVSAFLIIKIAGNGSDLPFYWIARPMMERALAAQTLPSQWNAGGAEAFASYTLTLGVNNYISGWRFNNDGTTGNFDVLADRFSIQSPGGGARTEYSNGNWRVYDAGGVLRVRMGVW